MTIMFKGTRVYHRSGLNTGTVISGGMCHVWVRWDSTNAVPERVAIAELGNETDL